MIMSDSMPSHVHSLSLCRQDVLRPLSLPHISPTSGVTKLTAEMYLNTDVYVTYIKHIWVDRYDVCVCVCVCARARAHDWERVRWRRFDNPALETSNFVSYNIMLSSTEIPSSIKIIIILFIN